MNGIGIALALVEQAALWLARRGRAEEAELRLRRALARAEAEERAQRGPPRSRRLTAPFLGA